MAENKLGFTVFFSPRKNRGVTRGPLRRRASRTLIPGMEGNSESMCEGTTTRTLEVELAYLLNGFFPAKTTLDGNQKSGVDNQLRLVYPIK